MKFVFLRMNYHPEDCNFVIEGIPSKPYNAFINNYYQIELNMKLRLDQLFFLSEYFI